MRKHSTKDYSRLVRPLYDLAEQETLDYILGRMRETLGDDMPDAKSVEDYLRHPNRRTTLTQRQQFNAMDKLLECAEVNFRTCCEMIRYAMLRDAGLVHSVSEYLRVFRGQTNVAEDAAL